MSLIFISRNLALHVLTAYKHLKLTYFLLPKRRQQDILDTCILNGNTIF